MAPNIVHRGISTLVSTFLIMAGQSLQVSDYITSSWESFLRRRTNGGVVLSVLVGAQIAGHVRVLEVIGLKVSAVG